MIYSYETKEKIGGVECTVVNQVFKPSELIKVGSHWANKRTGNQIRVLDLKHPDTWMMRIVVEHNLPNGRKRVTEHSHTNWYRSYRKITKQRA